MPELDECDQLLVTSPFADDINPAASSTNSHGILITLTRNSSFERHPLRSRSVSLPRCDRSSISPVTMVGTGGKARLGLLSLDGSSAEATAVEDRTNTSASEANRGGGGTIIHPVGPNDSFAGVALRYGVSIAALRRANQLWPSDPIHLRTELLIPRGDTLRARHRPTRSPGGNVALPPALERAPDLSSDLLASSFIAARNMVLSVLPARVSLDSLSSSSKATVSEDHELDDLQTTRARKTSALEAPLALDGLELSILNPPRTQYKLPIVSSSSHVPLPSPQHMDLNRISYFGDLRSRSTPSLPTISLGRPPRKPRPFAGLLVRTSQLEPEPAMELPVRRPRI